MNIKLIIGNVEISDQYGTSESKTIGVFDDVGLAEDAIKIFESQNRTRRTSIKITDLKLNEYLI